MRKSEKLPEGTAVVDSSVWTSALHFGGLPMRALEAVARCHRTVSCAQIRSEVERNLIFKFGWTAARVKAEMLKYLGSDLDLNLPGNLRGVCRDPKDDPILECAVVNEARIILSGDRDLLVLHPYAGIDILTPREFLDRIEIT